MTLSPEQLAKRRTGITATDVAAVVGLDPYRSAIDVFMDKVGQKQPFAGNEFTRWGNLLEPTIRDDYAERRGVRVEVPGTLEHPCVTWALATPDGICYRSGLRDPSNGLEIKTHSSRVADLYGEQGTDEVPRHELIQCMWNMYVSGLDSWDLVAFIDNRPRDYVIRRDESLIEILADSAEKFLVDHVRKGVPPEPDGSKGYDSYLSSRWSRSTDEIVSVNEDASTLATLAALRVARESLSDCEHEVDTLTQQIKLVIGDRAGISWTEQGKNLKITYRSSESRRTDWRAAFDALVQRGGDSVEKLASEIIAAHTTTSEGVRRFVVPRSWQTSNKEE